MIGKRPREKGWESRTAEEMKGRNDKDREGSWWKRPVLEEKKKKKKTQKKTIGKVRGE